MAYIYLSFPSVKIRAGRTLILKIKKRLLAGYQGWRMTVVELLLTGIRFSWRYVFFWWVFVLIMVNGWTMTFMKAYIKYTWHKYSYHIIRYLAPYITLWSTNWPLLITGYLWHSEALLVGAGASIFNCFLYINDWGGFWQQGITLDGSHVLK